MNLVRRAAYPIPGGRVIRGDRCEAETFDGGNFPKEHFCRPSVVVQAPQ